MITEDYVVVESGKSSTLKKVLKVIAIIALINIAINAIIRFFKARARKEEAKNEDKAIKEYHAVCDGKDIVVPEGEFKGMLVKSTMAGVKIDLTKTSIPDGAFISIKSVMSGIYIVVPENVNVIVDGKNSMSGIDNNVGDDNEDSESTLYVVGQFTMSGICIRSYEEEEDMDEAIC